MTLDKNVETKIQKRIEDLIDITNSRIVVGNDKQFAAHNRRVAAATRYLNELEPMQLLLSTTEGASILPRQSFTKVVREADEISPEIDGEFVQVVVVHKFPYEPRLIAYLKPLGEL